jgi:septum site-determining protein MinC
MSSIWRFAMNNITIKGNKDGILVYINSTNYMEIKSELITKIQRAKNFFVGCNLWLVNGQAKLSHDCYTDLERSLKNMFGINVLHSNEEKEIEKSDKVFSGIYEGRTKFVKNTVRSGQRINYSGNVIVIGDINSGAEVIAAGNIVVLGVLRGVAHAGSNGNRKAFVAAYMLQPSQLRIADFISRSPDDKGERPKIPEIAKIKDNNIIIEPYLPNKYI